MFEDIKDENMHIIVKDENGEDLDCEVVMFYDCFENGLKYVFYTDNQIDDDGDYNMYASRFLGIEDEKIQIGNIESDEEWDLLDNALEQARAGLKG